MEQSKNLKIKNVIRFVMKMWHDHSYQEIEKSCLSKNGQKFMATWYNSCPLLTNSQEEGLQLIL